jgi:hypothetical protein
MLKRIDHLLLAMPAGEEDKVRAFCVGLLDLKESGRSVQCCYALAIRTVEKLALDNCTTSVGRHLLFHQIDTEQQQNDA